VAATDAGSPPAKQAESQQPTEEDTMNPHPAIAAALAEQHRRALIAEAQTARLARAARPARDGSTRPARWFLPRRHPRIPAARRGLARLRPARAR
jgi:hypothetical protein